jgi:hypothetical protein
MTEVADPKPDMQERYALAASSGRALVLRQLDIGGTGPLETVIAAGVVAGARYRRLERKARGAAAVAAGPMVLSGSDEALAPLLFRLAFEWDTVKGDHALALKWQEQREQAVEESAQDLAKLMLNPEADPREIRKGIRELQRLRDEAKNAAVTEYHLMLTKLGTLQDVKDALFRWASIQASKFPMLGKVQPEGEKFAGKLKDPKTKQWRHPTHQEIVQWTRESFAGNDNVVRAITQRVLKAFLDPRCGGCHGTKKVFQALRGHRGKQAEGRYGLHHLVDCGGCMGTGLARHALGETDHERRFARHLLDRMQVLLEAVSRDMRRYLYANGGPSSA